MCTSSWAIHNGIIPHIVCCSFGARHVRLQSGDVQTGCQDGVCYTEEGTVREKDLGPSEVRLRPPSSQCCFTPAPSHVRDHGRDQDHVRDRDRAAGGRADQPDAAVPHLGKHVVMKSQLSSWPLYFSAAPHPPHCRILLLHLPLFFAERERASKCRCVSVPNSPKIRNH